MLCWDFPQVTGKSAGKRTPHVIKPGRFPKFVHLHCSNVKRPRPLCFFYAATTSVERIFKDWLSSSSAWMGHLEGSWLGPVFRLTCGLWPCFQRGALNENRTHKPLDSSHFGELKWGNGASPDWSKRKCLSEGEHCMCVWNTGGALHKEKWMCIYIKSIKLLMGAVQPEGKIDRFTTQTHQYNLKHVFEAPPIHKRNGAGLDYCVHGFIMDHCSFTPHPLLRRAQRNPTTMFLFCHIVQEE